MNMTKDYSNLLASAEKDVGSLLKVAKLQVSGEMKGSKEVFSLLKKNANEKTGAVAYYIYKLLIILKMKALVKGSYHSQENYLLKLMISWKIHPKNIFDCFQTMK